MVNTSDEFHKIAMGVSYFGPAFHGFQSQSSGRAVADYLANAVSQITALKTRIICAGRTDAKVHATEQVIHVELPKKIDIDAWTYGLNRILPRTVKVLWAVPVDSNFHARFTASARTYRYLIYQQKFFPVHLSELAYHSYRPLDIDRINHAASRLLGEHDFTGFQASGCQAPHAIRELKTLKWQQSGEWVVVTVTANAFLYRMVRNLVGSLLRVGYHEREIDYPYQRLVAKTRPEHPDLAPPHALYLDQIHYPGYNIPRVNPWYENLLEK